MRWRHRPKEVNTDEVPRRQQRCRHAAFSVNDEVVRQLQEWFYRKRQTDFPTTAPPGAFDRIIDRLEECGAELDSILGRATEIVEDRGRTLPGPQLIAPSERGHPLWDPELDG